MRLKKVEARLPGVEMDRAKRAAEIFSLVRQGITFQEILEDEQPDTTPIEKGNAETASIIQNLERSPYVDQAAIPVEGLSDKPDLEVRLINGVRVFVKFLPDRKAKARYLDNASRRWGINPEDLCQELVRRGLVVVNRTHPQGLKTDFEVTLLGLFPSLKTNRLDSTGSLKMQRHRSN